MNMQLVLRDISPLPEQGAPTNVSTVEVRSLRSDWLDLAWSIEQSGVREGVLLAAAER